ncbi:MarR family winged helix-turn-helix transcriptional regulator [Spongiactinospora sp. 9N601]|uniref:MarR family winged helix-turn-helix transcriptional regulator n=1 Tax=Spongiactinospora sp. 9N601 TaxID=3375149 RepID=UPI0037AC7724
MTQPEPDPLPSGLGDNLEWLIAQCFRAHIAALERAMSGIPHGLRGYQVLCAATHGSARNQAELGRQLNIDRTSMVYLVDALVTAGMVERMTDPGDRRNNLICPTPEGRARFAEAQSAVTGAESETLEPLAAADQDRFRELLRTIVAHHLAAGYETNPYEAAIRTAANGKGGGR